MKPTVAAFLALALASITTLGAQVVSYGLVYPARAENSKFPLILALLSGTIATVCAIVLALVAFRRASLDSERFTALLSLLLGAFFLFVVVAGFGIPELFLEPRD
jgi:hypothetical protein